MGAVVVPGGDATYRNITMWLGPLEGDGSFPVRVETVAGFGVPLGEPSVGHLPESWSERVDRLARGRLPASQVGLLAGEIGAALAAGDAGRFALRAYERLRGRGHRVRLRLVCTDPALAGVPWELAHVDGGFDGLALWENPDLSVIRLEPGQRAVEAEPLGGRMAVTLVEQRDVGGAYPALPPLLDRDEAQATPPAGVLDRAESDSTSLGGLVEVHAGVGVGATTDRIADSRRPVLVLFGHGDYLADEVQLLVESGDSTAALGGGALAGAAARGRPTVVVLVACRSGQRDSATTAGSDRWAGPAMALVRGGVPYVIALQHEARFDAARAFVHALLRALGRGDSVDAAVAGGRQAMRSAVADGNWLQAWLPVLYAFDVDGVARPFTVSQRVQAGRVGMVVAAEGDLTGASDGIVQSEVVAGHVDQVVGWRPVSPPSR